MYTRCEPDSSKHSVELLVSQTFLGALGEGAASQDKEGPGRPQTIKIAICTRASDMDVRRAATRTASGSVAAICQVLATFDERPCFNGSFYGFLDSSH